MRLSLSEMELKGPACESEAVAAATAGTSQTRSRARSGVILGLMPRKGQRQPPAGAVHHISPVPPGFKGGKAPAPGAGPRPLHLLVAQGPHHRVPRRQGLGLGVKDGQDAARGCTCAAPRSPGRTGQTSRPSSRNTPFPGFSPRSSRPATSPASRRPGRPR